MTTQCAAFTSRRQYRDRCQHPAVRGAYCLLHAGRIAGPIEPLTSATCTQCRQTKPLAAFFPRTDRVRGVTSQCRECEALRKHRYATSAQGRETIGIAYERRDPKKKAAQVIAASAIKRGKLVRWPVCAVPECSNEKPQAHHADYDRPLDVVWLCASHHHEAHKLTRSNHG